MTLYGVAKKLDALIFAFAWVLVFLTCVIATVGLPPNVATELAYWQQRFIEFFSAVFP